MNESDKIIWVEKYRPQTVDECILPKAIKSKFKSYAKSGDFPDLLLTGGAGTGKTTIARALCNELGYDVDVINASDERNIDVIRGRITKFASQTSLSGNKKAIILDEADGLNASSAQLALRAAMEKFSNVKFILTCNYKNKLIEPIHSRTTTISFNIKKQDRTETAVEMLKRVFEILEKENIEYDKKVVGAVIKKYYPDNRRILNELQGYAKGCGKIDNGMLGIMDKADTKELISACKDKNVPDIRQWVVNNIDTDPETLFREIYETFYKEVTPESVPQLIILIGNYLYNAAFVADQEINMMAFLMNVLGDVEFK